MPLTIGNFGTWRLDPVESLLVIQQAPTRASRSIELTDFRDKVHKDDRERLDLFWSSLASTDAAPMTVEFRMATATDAWQWFRFDGLASPSETGATTVTGIFVDNTATQHTADRQAEAVRRMQQFVASTSHDLQAPLRHISMYATILGSELQPSLTPQQGDMLRSIEKKAADLKGSVQVAMRFATSTRRPTIATVDLEHVFQRAFHSLWIEMEEAGATAEIGALPNVLADAGLLELATTKLIENTIHHRASGAPCIAITADKRGGQVFVSIKDGGPGIAEEYSDRIFDAYWSMPTSGNLDDRRQGLGLTVAKNIFLALGGNLILSKATRSGSTFTFELPAAKDD